MLKYLLLNKFCDVSGYTPDAVHAKKKEGKWVEGVIWFKSPDGKIHINLEEYEKWVETNYIKELKRSAHRQLKSPSPLRASGAERGLSSSPPPLT